jgi:hypothetical protein
MNKLKAVIEKAVEGGLGNTGILNVKFFPEILSKMEAHSAKVMLFGLLMSHDFARAFFGCEEVNAYNLDCDLHEEDPDWEGTLYSGGVTEKAFRILL